MPIVISLPITPEGRDLLRFMLGRDGGPGLRNGCLPDGTRLEGCDFDQLARDAIREVEKSLVGPAYRQSGNGR